MMKISTGTVQIVIAEFLGSVVLPRSTSRNALLK